MQTRMLSVRWWSMAVLLSSLLPHAAGLAAPPEAASGTEPIDSARWLARINAAARERNYQGTMVFTVGGAVSSSKVAHFCVGDQSFERLEALDGKMRKVYRHNETVQTVWPQSALAVIEKRGALSNLPSNLQTVDPRALEQYELKAEGRERLAGREALVFLLQPRDEWRFAQRVWADQASGLMLRADVLGPGRVVLESAAFSEIEIGVRPQPDSVLLPLRKLDGLKVLRPLQSPTQLETEGWSLKALVPGFRLSSCVRRSLDRGGSGEPSPPGGEVVQAVFTDGLTHVSLFIEPFDASRHRKDLSTQIGATHTLMLRRGDHWLTALGDVPLATLMRFAEAIERRR